MHQRAIRYEGDRHRNVEQRKPVQQEDTRLLRRRCQPIKREEEGDEPENSVDDFDRELHRREQQREQADVSRDGERSEGPQVSPVFEREQAEREDDEQDGLFVDVPAEEERGVAAQRQRGDEILPRRLQEELEQSRLSLKVSLFRGDLIYWGIANPPLTTCAASVKMKVVRGLISGKTANEVSPTKPRVTLLMASRLTGIFR